jgi:glycopeptide antibiotics resistance protein
MIGYEAFVILCIPIIAGQIIIQIKNRLSTRESIGRLLLTAYIISLISVTLFPIPFQKELLAVEKDSQGYYSCNFIPLRSIYQISTSYYNTIPEVIIKQIGGNIILLTPLAFLLPLLWKRFRAVKSTMVIIIVTACLIELMQFAISTVLGFYYKVTDVDDIILNTIGGLIGYAFYLSIDKLVANKRINTFPGGVDVIE